MAWFFTECPQKEIRCKNRPEFLPFYRFTVAARQLRHETYQLIGSLPEGLCTQYNISSQLRGTQTAHYRHIPIRHFFVHGTPFASKLLHLSPNCWLSSITIHTKTSCPIIGKPISGEGIRKRGWTKITFWSPSFGGDSRSRTDDPLLAKQML